MLNFFKNKSIEENEKDFTIQNTCAKVIIFKYLKLWLKQIFETPDYVKIFGETDIYITLAAQIENYLFGEDLDEISERVSPEIREKIDFVKEYIPKWADDVMTGGDKDFCEFVLQTLGMDMIFNQYFSDLKLRWLSEDPRGIRVYEIFLKYNNVSEKSDLEKYDDLLQRWMIWSDLHK
jgi:hypothetical protein